MPTSNYIYDTYLKPILENEDIWRVPEAFNNEFYELAIRLPDDDQVKDIGAVLDELVKRRRQLLKKYPLEDEFYVVDVDEEGSQIGEPRLTQVGGRL